MEIPVSSNDSYPPCEVTDLSITVDNDTATNVSITLKWTAPGDDLDEGIGIDFFAPTFIGESSLITVFLFTYVQFRITS